MCCRDRRADPCGEVDPERSRNQRGHHRPDEHIGRGHCRGGNDAFGNCGDHITAREERAGAFEDNGDGDGAAKGERVGANGGAHVVGDIVCADVERHVGAEDGGEDDHVVLRLKAEEDCSGQASEDHKGKRYAWAHHGACNILGGIFQIG